MCAQRLGRWKGCPGEGNSKSKGSEVKQEGSCRRKGSSLAWDMMCVQGSRKELGFNSGRPAWGIWTFSCST